MMINGKTQWGQFRQLAIWILVLLVMAAVQPFIWGFVTTSAERLQATRNAEEQSVALQARLKKITSDLENNGQFVDRLSLSFLEEGSAPQAVERLEQLAGRNGLPIEIISIENQQIEILEDQTEVAPLSLHARVFGSPAQLISYIDLVEHAPEIIDIRSWTIDIARDSESFASGKAYALDMIVYFYLLKGI